MKHKDDEQVLPPLLGLLNLKEVQCDVSVVCWFDACTACGLAGGLPFVARVVVLACVGGLACLVRVCLWWFPALVSDCLCMPGYCVSL